MHSLFLARCILNLFPAVQSTLDEILFLAFHKQTNIPCSFLFVRTLRRFHYFVIQLFFLQLPRSFTGALPCCNIHKSIIVTQRFAFRCLAFFAEVTTATFLTLQG